MDFLLYETIQDKLQYHVHNLSALALLKMVFPH